MDTAHGAASTAAAAAKTAAKCEAGEASADTRLVVGAGADVVECIFAIEEQSEEIGSRRIDRLHGPVPEFAAWSPEH